MVNSINQLIKKRSFVIFTLILLSGNALRSQSPIAFCQVDLQKRYALAVDNLSFSKIVKPAFSPFSHPNKSNMDLSGPVRKPVQPFDLNQLVTMVSGYISYEKKVFKVRAFPPKIRVSIKERSKLGDPGG